MYKPHFLFLIGFFLLGSIKIYAAWELAIGYSSTGSTGTVISAQAILGENVQASEAWDWSHDFPLGPPPMTSSYVRIHFPHSDWGVNNGNYIKDIRGASPAVKTWAIGLQNYNQPGNNFSLSWVLPVNFPAYYAPKLVISGRTIDMRLQNSYSFTTITSTCNIRMDFDASLPYLREQIPTQMFADNLPRAIPLSEYFGVFSGMLSYSFSPNEHLSQSLQSIGDSQYWVVNPVAGWRGSTSVNVLATGSSGSASCTVTISRDSTNSPPQIMNPIAGMVILQNQRGKLSWEDAWFDADLDDLSLSILAPNGFQVLPIADSLFAYIIPPLAFKGIDTLQVMISDGVNEAVAHEVSLNVQASEPNPPDSIVMQRDSSGALLLTWQDVHSDISGGPLNGLQYQIQVFSDAGCTILLEQHVTSENQFVIAGSDSSAFIRIISINE